ncbi:glycoside hydrolase family 3 protein [Deinococcus sp. S9]|uniref:glycoside hydrolase family 3 protein n=1 Tax=Deinococcus sp. S9 TaxID=2545754 RepID=UPI0010545FF6|nr:glycoside hydrolase family 3 protein [Deinococcus sp. S9]TDE86789.1 glycoside hydrolase family 3 protein [Deinococcus sp. S9]
MVDIPGKALDADTASHLRRHGIRAVCLFGKNVQNAAQLRQLCADLREVMGEAALIALDHEGGAILRPTFWPFAPSAMSLGAADNVALTEDVNAALARQLRSVGVNWNFAPVLDVNVNPANPVIGERAYGADVDRVIRHGTAALLGHTRERVAGCVKHFPGHGDTHLDSHYALPRVSKSCAELDAVEFAPFRACLPLAPAVMTAHIVYDALDPHHPATLSRAVLTELLRGEWGYQGVTVTDSMGMQAIDAHYGRGEAAVLALRAGADLVMALGRREAQDATLSAIAQALQGELNPREVEASLARLHALAAAFPAEADPTLDPQVDAPLFAHAWASGLTTMGLPQPPAPGARVLLVTQRQVARENVSEASVDAETLARDLGTVYDVTLHTYDDPADLDWPALSACGLPVLLATTTRHRQPALVGVRPDLHLALYNPYAAVDVQAPAVLTYGFRPEARAALLAWLRGDAGAPGRLPFLAEA